MQRLLVILDLDETLFHATEAPLDYPHDFRVFSYFAYRRPHVSEFLSFCFAHFGVAVWTSSSEDYAQEVVSSLFPLEADIAFLWGRERCTVRLNPVMTGYEFLKDLKKVKRQGYPLERVVVIDDSPEKLLRHHGNLIQVAPFTGDRADRELLLLGHYLMYLSKVENVRNVEKRSWREKARLLAQPVASKNSTHR